MLLLPKVCQYFGSNDSKKLDYRSHDRYQTAKSNVELAKRRLSQAENEYQILSSTANPNQYELGLLKEQCDTALAALERAECELRNFDVTV